MGELAAVWFMSLKFFADGELELVGPFNSGDECVQCGDTLTASAKEIEKRSGRKAGPGYVCMPQKPGDPPPPVSVRRTCEGS